MPPSDAYPALLQERLTAAFSRAELADLCLRLGVNFDSLPDAGLDAQARELVLLLARQGRLLALLALARAERPHVDWPPVPPDFRPPAAAAAAAPSAPSGGGITVGTANAQNMIIGNDAEMTVNYAPRDEPAGGSGDALPAVTAALREARQAVEALPAADDAARAGLIRLINRLDRALRAAPPGRAAEAEEVAGLARDLVAAAGAVKPRRSVVRALGDDLVQAAGVLAGAAPDLPAIAGSIAAAVAGLVDGA